MKVTIQQQINELISIKSSLYSAINSACTAHGKPTIPASKQGNFPYYAEHIRTNLCSADPPSPTSHTITVVSNDISQGTVSGGGTYSEGSTVTLRATARNGYAFVNWTKGGVQKSTNATYTFTASSSSAGEYVANFAVRTWTVTASSSDTSMGTVHPASSTVNYGGSVTLTATVLNAETHKFLGWKKDGGDEYVSTSSVYTVTEVTANASYTGEFAERVGRFIVNISGIGSVSYMVEGGTSATVVSGRPYSVPKDSVVHLTATPGSGYTFDAWSGDSSLTDISITFNAEEDSTKNFTATFVADLPERTTVLYHLCTLDEVCGFESFTQEALQANGTLGKISRFLDTAISNYKAQEITSMTSMYTTESFHKTAIFLIPKNYEITRSVYIDGNGNDQPVTFAPAEQGGGEHGYLFPKGDGETEDYYTYDNKQYSVCIALFIDDVIGVRYQIGRTN